MEYVLTPAVVVFFIGAYLGAIFGTGEQGQRLAQYIQGNERLTIDLVGFFDDREPARIAGVSTDLPLCGNLDELVSLVRQGRIDQVIIALPWSAERRLQDIVGALAVTPVRIRLASPGSASPQGRSSRER